MYTFFATTQYRLIVLCRVFFVVVFSLIGLAVLAVGVLECFRPGTLARYFAKKNAEEAARRNAAATLAAQEQEMNEAEFKATVSGPVGPACLPSYAASRV